MRLILRTVLFLSFGFCMKDFLLNWNLAIFLIAFGILCSLVLTIGCVDYSTVTIQNLPAFLVCSICGTYVVIQAGKATWLRWMKLPGRETLIIYGTHGLYYVVFGKLIGITDFRTTPFLLGLAVLAMTAIAEIPTVYLLNRFLSFAVGKRKTSPQKPVGP
jgi:fucose 4-O-acetylase-like acetyltransferase